MNNYLIFGLLLFTISLGILYWFKYYSNLNAVVRGKKALHLKVTPMTFNIAIILGLLVVVSSFSIIKANALESENNDLMKILDYERFDDGNFPHGLIKIAYEEYNIYFSGYYLDSNNNYVVCLTEDVPTELTDALTNGGIQFVKVRFSYSELKEVYKILSINIKNYNFASVSLSMKNNRVEVTIVDETIDLSQIQAYIQEGIVTVTIGEAYNPL
ncbi:MAG: hypothetical protein CVV57_01460 [Tenericutes bacterium HGW-Tenericutes-2]|jgi:hypothetical protein|nr:MAG: hypothetical protein CVV57_01460 [Tenericutes bacterium HGW-Tenericutes-2]